MTTSQRATIVIAALLCSACGILDSYRSDQKAEHAVADLLVDPTSAAFRNVAERNGHVCGEVNAKNKVGAFVGFKRFVVNKADWKAQIDPRFDYRELLSAEELCSSMRTNAYSSFSTTETVCSDANEKRRTQIEQDEFDGAWGGNCAASVRRPFQPELSSQATEAAPQNGADAVIETPPSETDSNAIAEMETNDESVVDGNNTVTNEAGD